MKSIGLTKNTHINPERATPLAVNYIRSATREQHEPLKARNVREQQLACREKAKQLGAKIDAEYMDIGTSGREAKRAGLVALLKRVKQEPHVDYVIVHRLDRLSRSLLHDAQLRSTFASTGTSLISCSEEIDQTPSTIFIQRILSIIGEFHSREMGEASRRGRLAKAGRGETPDRTPTGYLNVSTRKHGRREGGVEIDSVRGPIIARTFETYAKAATAGIRSTTKSSQVERKHSSADQRGSTSQNSSSVRKEK